MSLPNYLARIKSSGIYRFVWDKSVVPSQVAETLRLVIGYSDKGPFNTPVYIDNAADFINIYGDVSKKMERKGIFFNRLALQALQSAPILALNLKPFSKESVSYTTFDAKGLKDLKMEDLTVKDLYDTNRFWVLDENQLPNKIKNHKYMTITATDTHDSACTLYMRKVSKEQNAGFNITIREWFASNAGLDMPSYLEEIQDDNLQDYFMEIYVFKGKFTDALCKNNGPLSDYFVPSADGFFLNPNYTNAFDEKIDVLEALAEDSNSNFVGKYKGTTLPYFKDANGNYISLDVLFNADHSTHKMLMKLDEGYLYDNEGEGLMRDILSPCENPVLIKKEDENYDYLTNADYEEVFNAFWQAKIDEQQAIIDAFTTEDENRIKELTEILEKTPEQQKELDALNLKQADSLAAVDELASVNKQKAEAEKTYKDMPVDEFEKKYCESGEIGDILSAASAENIYIDGYTYSTLNDPITSKMMKGLELQHTILGQLKDKGIYTALTNRIDVQYRYIVDTFRGYIEPGCKAMISALTKGKDSAFAIIGFPPMEDFVNDPRFKSKITGKFDIAEIAKKENGFSLPSEIEGASWAGYFTSLKFSDGAQKTYVPSTALVSNNFMEKYGPRQPYYIVAGPTHGKISYTGMVGPDYNYGRTDLDVLEPLGVNAIIYVPRKGTFINSNQTAKQTPVSGLSKIHIRELVIYLQDEIEALLQDYQWELNTQTLRDKIKAKADVICERVMNNGGLYAFTNVCDESNNTPEIIDNEMIILDTAIEPARGAGKMVQTLTIHKTGGITSK